MGSITNLYAEIETIVGQLSTASTYLRATSKEANLDLENIDIGTPMVISIDRTQMVVVTGGGGYQSLTVPIEIYFVEKQNSQDEKLSDNDLIVDNMTSLAIEFYQYLQQSEASGVFDPTQPLEDFSLDRLQAYELFDTVMTGVLFELDIFVDVTEYNCRP